MSDTAVLALARGMIMLSLIAPAIGEALVLQAAFNAIGRNPKLEATLWTKVMIGVGLVESTAIYALLAFYTVSVGI